MVQAQEEEDIWGHILKEATRKNVDTIESRTVLVLGDRNSGKSSLLARTHHEDITDINKGVALTYTFLDVYESDNEDPVGRIDFWQLEGEPAHADLTQLALNETSLPQALALIVLDFSQPWALASTLKKWLALLSEQVKAVKKAPKHLQEQNRLYAQTYKEPSPDAANSKKKKKKLGAVNEDTSLLPPLDEAVLTTNLGIPIVVVCTKCDSVAQLEKDFDYSEGIFEYIQQYLRRICLSYGATLMYTSARKDTNCDLLVDYIEHRLFGFELRQRAQLAEKETIFVPFGWDSMAKVKLDFENQKVCKDPDEAFENVVKKPTFLKRREQVQIMSVNAEEDQAFLLRHKATLDKDSESDKKEKETPKGDGKGLLGTMLKMGGGAIAMQSSASLTSLAANNNEEEDHPPVPTPSISSPPISAAASLSTAPAAPTAAGATAPNEKAVLANFFTSLMNKGDSGRSAKIAALTREPGARTDVQKATESLKKGFPIAKK